MPSKIAELNDLANQCQQDIDMESTHRIKMGGNALINMNYAVSKNQFLDIRMLTATAIKIKPSASFKLSDKILDSIAELERLWDL
jgi:hypothetical protein